MNGSSGQSVNRITTCVLVAVMVPLGIAAAARLLGYETLVVSGGSMGSTVPRGSLAIGRWTDAMEIGAQAVILVEPTNGGAPYLHRVVSVHRSQGTVRVTTKGDANATADPGTYALPQPVLVSVLALPWLGALVSRLVSPLGVIALLVLMPLVFVGNVLRRGRATEGA